MKRTLFFSRAWVEFKKMDIERLFMISMCTFFVVSNVSTIIAMIRSFDSVSWFKILRISHQTLLLFFNALIIILYLIRHKAQATCKSWFTKFMAFLGTCLPLLLNYLSKPETINPGVVLAGDSLIVCGMVFCVYSLGHLGRSFSVIPQARKMVQSGPYKFVRHPLYLGELISSFGSVLVAVTLTRMLFFFCLVFCQVYRALQEEKILNRVFLEYQSYRSKTARFLPRIF